MLAGNRRGFHYAKMKQRRDQWKAKAKQRGERVDNKRWFGTRTLWLVYQVTESVSKPTTK
jgi:hypothetical protein